MYGSNSNAVKAPSRPATPRRGSSMLSVNTDGSLASDDETGLSTDENGHSHANGSSSPHLPVIYSFSKQWDPAVSFFYEPATLTLFGFVVATVALLAYSSDHLALPKSIKERAGILSGIASFLLYSVLQGRDGPFRRPHPAFWRAVLGTNFLYFAFLAHLFWQDKNYARTVVMPYFSSDLGVPYHAHGFDDHCEFTVHNVQNQALEIFSLAHALGWFGKALIIRDWWLINILSITYELIEYSLMHQLPEFRECWWDHWLLDVAGCNFIGSWLGMKVCKWMQVSHLNWRGSRQYRRGSLRDRSTRALESLTPFDFANFSWESVKHFRNYASTVVLLATFLTSETNVFYLKHLLWVPSHHPLVTIRLAFTFLWALPATREFYEYVNHSKQVRRMGVHAWLLMATVILELLIVLKFSKGEFSESMPGAVKAAWSVVAALLVIFPVVRFLIPKVRRRQERLKKRAMMGSRKSR